jgi:hypothetical protein
MSVKIVNKIGAFVSETEKKAYTTLTKVLLVGGANASQFTPVDTSTLLNSQYREVKRSGKGWTGRIGYTAYYAQYVHDPNIKQRFRRQSAKKEFLRLGFEDSKDMIDEIVKKGMKV